MCTSWSCEAKPETILENLRFSTGEVEGLRAERLSDLLRHMAAADGPYVPRGKNYFEAFAAEMLQRFPTSAPPGLH